MLSFDCTNTFYYSIHPSRTCFHHLAPIANSQIILRWNGYNKRRDIHRRNLHRCIRLFFNLSKSLFHSNRDDRSLLKKPWVQKLLTGLSLFQTFSFCKLYFIRKILDIVKSEQSLVSITGSLPYYQQRHTKSLYALFPPWHSCYQFYPFQSEYYHLWSPIPFDKVILDTY